MLGDEDVSGNNIDKKEAAKDGSLEPDKNKRKQEEAKAKDEQ